MSELLLEVKGLTLGYESHVLVEDLSFGVESGDYLCVVGKNGSGKSTLMRTLLRLQPPLAGEIIAQNGLKLSETGYLPQQTPAQRDFPASVREIVISGCQGRRGALPFYSRADRALARQNMTRMGVSELSGRSYRTLSGGQQQRVLLARALCASQRLLLLDEPVAGLDPMVTRDMYELIAGLNREGLTVIMISHDIGAALRFARHILHIGDTMFYGTAADYAKSELGRRFAATEGGDARV